jgi:hypothetical protein
LKPYLGKSPEELSFRLGEKILIEQYSLVNSQEGYGGSDQDGLLIGKFDGSSAVWLCGSIGASRRGWFPASSVKVEEHFV